MAERRHTLMVPTYAGLGERSALADPGIDLETHIGDVIAVLERADLTEVILVGHSYGGMVATAVADRVGERIAEVIYLDAFVPRNGQSVFDFHTSAAVEAMRAAARADGDGWRIPPGPLAPDTRPEDVAWLTENRRPQPLATFEQKVTLTSDPSSRRSYIYCRKKGDRDPFGAVAEQLKMAPGWGYFELDSGHTPNVTMPATLSALLHDIVVNDA
jgi:pimeloyl-ACP methyl ester carboxylesterase